MKSHAKLPLLYSCSGASSAAQMANHLAVKMDRLGVAEMSCIAGVGGDVTPLVRTAKSGRPIIAVDGCPLHCAAQVLKRHGLAVDKHYDLSEMGVPKTRHEDFDPGQAAEMLKRIVNDSKAPVSGISKAANPTLSPPAPEEELPEPSSPVCYAREFEDR